MNTNDLRWQKCTFCSHEFIYHYSTYVLDTTKFRPIRQGCSTKYIPDGHKFVEREDVTMETVFHACPCLGFSTIVERDEYGHPLQQQNS